MIEWIQHWDEMRFYYKGMSGLILWPLYLVQLVAIGALWWVFSKLNAKLWVPLAATAVLLPAAAIWPWWEELGIAYNFGQLCKKDAGIFIYKTVEVEGYFDASAGLLQINNPVLPVTAKSFDERGYKFYEMSLADTKGGPSKVAHFEKVNGEWVGAVLDHPTARYHFFRGSGRAIGHKLAVQESRIVDTQTSKPIAEYRVYIRQAPWFFVGLDRPSIGCDSPGGGPHSKHESGFLIYRDVLKPIN